MAKQRTFQFLRNGSPAASRVDAINLLKEQASNFKDGEIIIGRYTEEDKVRSLIGVMYKPAEGTAYLEIIPEDRINGLDVNTIQAVTSSTDDNGNVTLTFKGTKEVDGMIKQGEGTDTLILKKVATTGKAEDVTTATVECATYTYSDLTSQNWKDVVRDNALETTDNVETSVEKLDTKIAGLANELIANEEVIKSSFEAVQTTVGMDEDFALEGLNATSAKPSTAFVGDVDTVVKALNALDDKLADTTDKSVNDVKINGTTIVSGHIASIAVDGAYDATSNQIATKSTVSTAIDAITGAGLDVSSEGAVTATTQDTTDDNTNVATTEFVHNVVETLDAIVDADTTTASEGNVVPTLETPSTDFKVLNAITETDGKLTAATAYQLKKVAATGAAADVAVADARNKYIATDVEGVLYEIATRLDAQAGGMRYNGGISTATAIVNDSTNDIRRGDIYLATAAFTIGTTSVEVGDMIVYKGNESTSAVDLTAENCNVIEKESDLMVTANGTLTADAIMLGDGNKTTKVSASLTETTVTTAQTRAATALQTITKGTDGDYVTTTVGTKTGDDGDNTQTIATAVTVQAVSTASADNKGLAEASDVKNYVDTAITNNAVQTVVDAVAVTNGTNVVTVSDTLTVDNTTQTAQSFTIAGDAEVKVSSADNAISLAHEVHVVTPTIGDAKSATAASDSITFNVPALTINGTGHVTALENTPVTVTLPARIDTAVQTVLGDTTTNDQRETALNNNEYVNVTAVRAENSKDVKLQSSVKTVNLENVTGNWAFQRVGNAEFVASEFNDGKDVLISDISSTTTWMGLSVKTEPVCVSNLGTRNCYVTITTQEELTTFQTAIQEGGSEGLTYEVSTKSRTASGDGLATAVNVRNYVDTTIEKRISTLDADKTSDDEAVATVEVKEIDGKITDVIVTNVSAGVTGNATTLYATTTTGAVTGDDIAKIKDYIDGKASGAATTVSSVAADAIKVTGTEQADGHTDYDVTLKLANKAHVGDTTEVSIVDGATNLLKVDNDGELSMSDTWDCGTF